LEIGDILYGHVPFVDEEVGKKQRCLCLIIAAAARLDIENMDSTTEKPLDINYSLVQESTYTSPPVYNQAHKKPKIANKFESIPSLNLSKAAVDASKASQLLNFQSDFADNDHGQLRKSTILIEFATLCKLCNIERCVAFIKVHESDFLSLSSEELRICADIARFEDGGSVEIARTMLMFALQVNTREAKPNYRFIGEVYCQLIELSPSRQTALDKVEEFEQLASTVHNAHRVGDDATDQGGNFDTENVDRIVSLAYNYGVTLVDLDQVDLAEKFVSKAINLLRFTSTSLQAWLPRMQVFLLNYN
jgi:hypothetical protein